MPRGTHMVIILWGCKINGLLVMFMTGTGILPSGPRVTHARPTITPPACNVSAWISCVRLRKGVFFTCPSIMRQELGGIVCFVAATTCTILRLLDIFK